MVLMHMADKNGADRIKCDAQICDFSFGIAAAVEKIISTLYLQKINRAGFIGLGGTMAGTECVEFHRKSSFAFLSDTANRSGNGAFATKFCCFHLSFFVQFNHFAPVLFSIISKKKVSFNKIINYFFIFSY